MARQSAERVRDLEVRLSGIESNMVGNVSIAAGVDKASRTREGYVVAGLVDARAGDRLLVDGDWLGVGDLGRHGSLVKIFNGRYGMLRGHAGGAVYLVPRADTRESDEKGGGEKND